MNYETFLFTRNQRRDFTAFIRPKELTNKDVSVIASALNYIHDISMLSPEFPALYCFPLGQYILLLRHYNSLRQHAGRDVGVIEGIAVRTTLKRHFARALPHLLAHQQDILAIADRAGDIETLETTPSTEFPLPDVQAETLPEHSEEDPLVNDFIARLEQDRLFIPFNEDGWAMLLAALSDARFPSLYFAFGSNSDALARLSAAGVQVDIVSYFNTSIPSLRSRATNEITSELHDYTSRYTARTPTRPSRPRPPVSDAAQEAHSPENPLRTVRPVPAPRPAPKEDILGQFDAGEGMLSVREMARRARTQESTDPTPEEREGLGREGLGREGLEREGLEREGLEREGLEREGLITWLGGLLARLLGRR